MNPSTTTIGTTVKPQPVRRTRGIGFWTRRIFLGLLVLLVALPAAGATYQAVATALDRRAYPAPGERINVGGYKLHITCLGAGSPTVILLHGNGGSALDWYGVQPAIARTTRACAYDRAGSGWSDAGPGAQDARHGVAELHTLLANAGIPGPYVLVGHSFGGLYSRLYAAQYPDQVAGMVLLDATHPDQWTRTPAGQTVYTTVRRQVRLQAWLARIGIARLLLTPHALPPGYDMPAQTFAAWQAIVSSTRDIDAGVAEFGASPTLMDDVRATHGLGAMPLAVVTARGDHTQGIARSSDVEALHLALQRELAGLSTNSTQQVVEDADHSSLLFNPTHRNVAIVAISRVLEAVRTGQPLAR
jgi:pimeloyl-ACP methyl ester carboxylesterase